MAMTCATTISLSSSTGLLISSASSKRISVVSQQRPTAVLRAPAFRVNGGVRAGAQTQIQASSPLYNSSSLTRCIHCPSKSSNRSIGLAGNLQPKLIWNEKFSRSGLGENASRLSRQRIRRVPSASLAGASLAGPGTVEVAANLFQLATAFVVPFYTVMILAPQWEWTKKLMESELTYFILGAGYIYLLCLSWTPQTPGLMFSSKYWLPELSGITRMFASTLTVASAWLHLLAADLFAGRQVFLDGLNHNVETRHSLVLCLMMCPIGIFSHLLTKSVVLFLRRATSDEGSVEVSNEFPPY